MARFARKMFDVYTPEAARYKALAEGVDMMKEYQEMRKVAQERLRKLEKAGNMADAIYRDNINRFPRKSEIGSDARMLYDAIADISHFLAEKKSTVGGYKQIVASAVKTFTENYGSEGLTGMDWKTFGEMMKGIKSHAKSKAYYSGWKNAYRSALSNARKRGMTADDLNAAVAAGQIKIGVRGGLKDASGRRLR